MVEGEESGEDLLGGEVGGPAVGGEGGFVEGAVGVREPGGALVVEVGQGAFLEVFRGGGGRVEPGVAEADERAGGVCDGFDEGRFGFGGFSAGWPGEGEGVEGGVRRVARAALELSSHVQRPKFVNGRVQDAKEVVVFPGESEVCVIRDNILASPNEKAVFGNTRR